MKIKFGQVDPKDIIKNLEAHLGGRKLGDIVSFESDDNMFRIIINKLGKSVIEFKKESDPSGLVYSLQSEKIAFAHKIFKEEVTNKIMKIIQEIGGKVS